MKPLRFVALITSVLFGVVVLVARGMQGYPVWVTTALGYASVAAGVLLLVSLLLVFVYGKLYERGGGGARLAYEAVTVFIAAFSIAAIVVLVPAMMRAANGGGAVVAETSAADSSEASGESASAQAEASESATEALAEWLNMIDLDELKTYVDGGGREQALIYFGRDGCPACEELGEALAPALAERGKPLTAYYTSQDRSGERADEMRAVLEQIGVSSVPTFVLLEDGAVVQSWGNPKADLDEILAYL